ncbi:MAG: BREX system ATP-binding protein BrxD [Polyangiaceae bacterium]|nr:BREX system ATP-binding protein BrxD [Polyangiaceae bacterium]
MSNAEAQEIVAALRSGLVPRSGLHHFATGLDALMSVVAEELDFVSKAGGRGGSKFIRGDYGSGKTFATRLLCTHARQRGFATSEVQISINDTPLHHLETVYRRLVERLTTDADGEGAFAAVVDAWLYEIGEEVTRLQGLGETDPGFAEAVEKRLEDKLAELSAKNPAFSQVLRAYHRALGSGDFGLAQGLLGWLSGQPHVDRSVTSKAGIKGAVDGQAALTFLRGVLLLLRQSGHAGLVVVLDEVETIQRMPAQTREKSLNALRQLMDMLGNNELPGFYLVVTGTPEFFDGYKGVKSQAALYQRVAVRFGDEPRHDNLRAPQVRLAPFDTARLLEVGRRVRSLFPAHEPERVSSTIDDTFLSALVDQVTAGFGGKVTVTPRLFLRELVDVLDRVDLHADYDPRKDYRLEIDEAALRPEELAARRGEPVPDEEELPNGEPAGDEAPAGKRKRLDG